MNTVWAYSQVQLRIFYMAQWQTNQKQGPYICCHLKSWKWPQIFGSELGLDQETSCKTNETIAQEQLGVKSESILRGQYHRLNPII